MAGEGLYGTYKQDDCGFGFFEFVNEVLEWPIR